MAQRWVVLLFLWMGGGAWLCHSSKSFALLIVQASWLKADQKAAHLTPERAEWRVRLPPEAEDLSRKTKVKLKEFWMRTVQQTIPSLHIQASYVHLKQQDKRLNAVGRSVILGFILKQCSSKEEEEECRLKVHELDVKIREEGHVHSQLRNLMQETMKGRTFYIHPEPHMYFTSPRVDRMIMWGGCTLMSFVCILLITLNRWRKQREEKNIRKYDRAVQMAVFKRISQAMDYSRVPQEVFDEHNEP